MCRPGTCAIFAPPGRLVGADKVDSLLSMLSWYGLECDMAEKWIQEAIKRPGALREKMGAGCAD